MFGRGSPRITLIQTAAVQKKPSPKISSKKKTKASPKAVGDRSRANWNGGLEKGLVDLLHDHNNDCYKGQNGWSSEAWNRIVRLFHEKFPYVNFSKTQIQDKERELKRGYRILKEARKQSGVSWDNKLCMIEADEPIWNNIITSDARAKKFRNRSFPLFESLGELYDGQIVEGTLNFTSIAPSQIVATHPSQGNITQPSQDAFTQPYQGDVTQDNYIGEEAEKDTFVHNIETDDEEVRIVEQAAAANTAVRSRMGKRVASSRKKDTNASDKEEKAGQRRRQDGKVVEMMGRFIEMKEKQAEVEAAQLEKTRANGNEEFSIPMCISIVDSMEELTDDEKVEAYDVFKDAQNRSIFMTAKASTRLKWLKKKITST